MQALDDRAPGASSAGLHPAAVTDVPYGAPAADTPDSTGAEKARHLLGRSLEVLIGTGVLLIGLPVMLIIAAMIRRDSPGPALFFQTRLGQYARPIRFVKFRTMYADARERFPELYRYQYTDDELAALRFKVTDDPRVTPVGRWLRRSSLDELPNFWNLITGEVALVGPRPEIPEMLAHYKGDELRKFDVRPGITGYAQVFGRGNLRFAETLALDLAYVRERSWKVDLRVTLRTIKIAVLGHGAF